MLVARLFPPPPPQQTVHLPAWSAILSRLSLYTLRVFWTLVCGACHPQQTVSLHTLCVLNLGLLFLPLLYKHSPFTRSECFEPDFSVSISSADCPFTRGLCHPQQSFSSKRVVCTEVGGFCHSQETVSLNAACYELELATLFKLFFF